VILDLYSGVGVIARHLVGPERFVIGVEEAPHAVADAIAGEEAEEAGGGRLKFVTARAEAFLADPAGHVRELRGRELAAVVVNPPRAGLSPEVTSELLRLRPRQLAYVSCRPATLARDLALLAREYEVLAVTPVDMLPLTPHIEALALLQRRDGP
jgi:tRNA/tmRNA/rRNA uracil-C5-methylase (TrmA/RlmC/RlmD family)